MVLEHKDFIMAKLMLGVTKKIGQTDRGNITGRMATTTKEHFQMVWGTDRAISNKENHLYNTEVNIKTTKNAAMAK